MWQVKGGPATRIVVLHFDCGKIRSRQRGTLQFQASHRQPMQAPAAGSVTLFTRGDTSHTAVRNQAAMFPIPVRCASMRPSTRPSTYPSTSFILDLLVILNSFFHSLSPAKLQISTGDTLVYQRLQASSGVWHGRYRLTHTGLSACAACTPSLNGSTGRAPIGREPPTTVAAAVSINRFREPDLLSSSRLLQETGRLGAGNRAAKYEDEATRRQPFAFLHSAIGKNAPGAFCSSGQPHAR